MDDGCERGSWDPNSKWGRQGGRIYSTALAILTLEVYYRYTPQNEVDTGSFELHVGGQDDASPGVPAAPEPVWLPVREPEVDKPQPKEIEVRGQETKD